MRVRQQKYNSRKVVERCNLSQFHEQYSWMSTTSGPQHKMTLSSQDIYCSSLSTTIFKPMKKEILCYDCKKVEGDIVIYDNRLLSL